MATTSKATLSANDDVCGPIVIGARRQGVFQIDVTGTITVTLQMKGPSTNWITCKKSDETTDAAYTADAVGQILAPGEYRLLASAVSGGSAVCLLHQG